MTLSGQASELKSINSIILSVTLLPYVLHDKYLNMICDQLLMFKTQIIFKPILIEIFL